MKQVIITMLVLLVLALSVRGLAGNPNSSDLTQKSWMDNGPFELSVERGRFALVYTLIENHSFALDIPLARFSTPDVGYIAGKYVSIFAPGVSFLVIPGYVIGKLLGISQIGTFFSVSIFAAVNFLLIWAIAKKLGASNTAGTIGGLIFTFATPAFAYSTTLYQHHISTFIILSALYALVSWRGWKSLFIVWFLCGLALAVDSPNFFLLLPVGIYALLRLVSVKRLRDTLSVKMNFLGLTAFFGLVFPLLFFFWFNKSSYGNPFQLSGTVRSISGMDELGRPLRPEELEQQTGLRFDSSEHGKSSVGFFRSRNLLNGLYIHLISPDRGVVYFAPVIILGIAGMFVLFRRHPEFAQVLIATAGINLVLYSMWGDPWGGWAFGSRYLIPLYSIMAIFVSFAVSSLKHNLLFMSLFVILGCYSIAINTAGAITSNANPPQIQVLELERITGRQEKYTVARNFDHILNNNLKSAAYLLYIFHFINGKQYYLMLSGLIAIAFIFSTAVLYVRN